MYYCGDLDEGIYLSAYFILKKIKKRIIHVLCVFQTSTFIIRHENIQ